MAAKLAVIIEANTKQFNQAMGDLGNHSGLTKLGAAAGKVGKAIAAGVATVAAASGALVVKGIQQAGDLEQSIGAVDAVFKGSANQMHGWASKAADSVGLSRNAYNELATIMGAQLKNGGTAVDQLGTKTNDLIKLGADLSSMFGGSTADAVGALSSALKGERDPIERYGVSLKQATIDAKAMQLGFKKTKDGFSAQAQQAATLALIMDQTKDAQGNFSKETDTQAHKIEVLKAKFENITTRLGTFFLPMVTAVAGVIERNLDPAFNRLTAIAQGQVLPALRLLGEWMQTNVLPVLRQLGQFIRTDVVPVLRQLATYITGTVIPALIQIGGWISRNRDWFLALVGGITAGIAVWKIWTTSIMVWSAITKAAAAVQAIFNAVLAANPIMLLIIVIAALVAAIVILWQRNETFRRVVTNVWNAVSTAVTSAGSKFMEICRAIGSAVSSAWSTISGFFGSMPSRFSSWFNGAKTSAVQALNNLVGFVTGIPGRISSALGGLGGLLVGAGRSIMDGLLQGLRDSWAKVQNMVSSVASWISENKGPISYDRRLLTPHGKAIMAGLVEGLRDSMPRLEDMVGDMTATITGLSPRVPMPPLAGVAAAGSITVNVQALNADAQVGRMIVDVIRDAQRTGVLR